MVRLRFRTVLVAVTLSLLLATVAVIGTSALVFARRNAEQLSRQVLVQASLRIREQVSAELKIAADQGELDRAMLASGKIDPRNRDAVSAYFLDAIQAHPQLSYLSWTLDATGDHVTVERDRDGKLSVTYLIRQPDGRLELHHIAIENGARRELEVIPDKAENDPRPRPYYRAAVAEHGATWTETYVFLGQGGRMTVPGVTRATPVYAADGALLGVLSADFDLYALSEFLGQLNLSKESLALLVEQRRDRSLRVIGHPDLAAMDKDPRAAALVQQIARGPALEASSMARIELDGYLGAYRIVADRGLMWIVAVLLPEDEVLGAVAQTRRTTILVTVIATGVAILLTLILAMQIGKTLRRLAAETEAIGRFLLAAKPIVASNVVEVRQLAQAIEDMKRGLRSFQKYVPTDLVRRLLESRDEAVLGGHRVTLTMHFSDIADFTTISESMRPEELVELLSEYLSLMSEDILATGGTIDKYIGDAVMAFWNAPRTVEDHAFVACKTVLGNQAKLEARRAGWVAAGKPALRARVGLHTGDAVVGNIGSEARLDFTAIGDTVNLASRLEGLNKSYGTEVLLSEATYALVADRVVARPLDRVAVKGKHASIAIYELVALRADATADQIAAAERHARAMDAYFAQRWDEALDLLGDDDASMVIRRRIEGFQVAPPPTDWDGVHRMTSK